MELTKTNFQSIGSFGATGLECTPLCSRKCSNHKTISKGNTLKTAVNFCWCSNLTLPKKQFSRQRSERCAKENARTMDENVKS